jgi:uracil-DNA glycosylase
MARAHLTSNSRTLPEVTRRAVPGSRGRTASWEELSREIRACRRCPLGATRTHAVVYRGGPRPEVVFVGEAPGAEEDRLGLPFVGRSGQRLDRAIRQLGLASGSVGILNIVKCRPPENRFDRAAAAACRPFLDRQLDLLRPRVVVTLGAHALEALAPDAPRVLAAAGRAREERDPPIFPMIHPAAAMRSRRWAERWTHDLAAFERWWGERGTQTS